MKLYYKSIRVFCSISILLLAFSSCARLISDEFPEFEPIPALNCILVSGDSLSVHISMAEKIDSTEHTLIENAIVQVENGESESFSLEYNDNGLYTSTILIESGSHYHVSVLIDGYPEILAHDSVPSPAGISILSQTNTAKLNEEGYFMPGIELDFIDDPLTVDYYELIIYKRTEDYLNPAPAFNEQNKILLNEGFEPYTTESLVFSDELIETEYVNMNLIYGNSYSSSSSNGSGVWYQNIREYTAIVELRHISKEYYHFKKSFYFYENSRYAEFIEGTATSYPIYSNIENGLGIFASYSSSIDSIFVEAETIKISK